LLGSEKAFEDRLRGHHFLSRGLVLPAICRLIGQTILRVFRLLAVGSIGIGISILGFEWFKKDDRYHHVFHLRDDETGEKLNVDLELHYLELPKLKHLKRGPQSALEEWLVYLGDIQGEGLEAIVMSNPMIGKALSIEEQFKANAQERRLYDMREKAIFPDATNLAAAKAEGKAETICQYLEVRFGAESQVLQEMVRTIRDLDVLGRITNKIFLIAHLDEATALIKDYLVSQ